MSRDLRLLAGAAGLSALGDFMAVFPLIMHVQQSTGSAFAVSALVFALWGPVVLAAGLAGAIVDRFENRALLIVVSFAQAAVVAGMVAGADELWAVLPLMALLGFGVAVSQPAEFALVPAAAERSGDEASGRGSGGDVGRANGLMETARSLGFTAGPLVGGALGAAGLLRLALAINALSFVVVGVTALIVRARRRPTAHHDDTPLPRAGASSLLRSRAFDGFAFLLRERDLALALGGAVAALAVFSISVTAEPFFITEVLHGGPLAYGVLLTSWTLGMAAGSGALAHRVPRRSLAAAALVAVVLQGLGIAGAALSPLLWMALIGFVFGGVAHGVKNVLLRTLIHERVPDALRGRAFAAYNGARNGAELGALALGGLAVAAFGARTALLVAGVGPALIGLACLFLLTTTLERRVIHARVEG
jgi:MFS family permease